MSQNLVKGRNGRRRRWSNWGGECDKGGGNTILGGQGATDGERECRRQWLARWWYWWSVTVLVLRPWKP